MLLADRALTVAFDRCRHIVPQMNLCGCAGIHVTGHEIEGGRIRGGHDPPGAIGDGQKRFTLLAGLISALAMKGWSPAVVPPRSGSRRR